MAKIPNSISQHNIIANKKLSMDGSDQQSSVSLFLSGKAIGF